MLFGKSVFQSILTRLDEEQFEEAEGPPSATFRVSGLPMGFVAETVDVPQGQVNLQQLYEIDMDDLPFTPEEEPAAPPVMPAHLARLTDAEIAEDLDLKPGDSAHRLIERRRAFAKLNHPDLVHPEFRAQATRRMTVANMLIDQALRLHTPR